MSGLGSSLLNQLQNALNQGLSNPSPSVSAFQANLAAATSFSPTKAPTDSAGKMGGQPPLEAMLGRSDPVTSMDWVGFVVDRGNPMVLDWYYINSIQTPSIQIETKSVFRAGKLQHYAGTLSVGNINVILYTDSGGKTLKFVSSWINSVYDNQTGNYRLPKDYKKDIYVYLLDTTRAIVCQFKFFGCTPTDWASYGLQSGAAEPLHTTLDLTVDSFSLGSDAGPINSQLGLLSQNETLSGIGAGINTGNAFNSILPSLSGGIGNLL